MAKKSIVGRRRFVGKLLGNALLGLTATQAAGKSMEDYFVPQSQAPRKKLGVALVGLGKYSTEQLAPALQETQRCYLAGIVTGTPEKARDWKEKYNIPDKNIYNYQNYDSIKDNPDIDIVYVVLPNGMHAEYTIRGAKAGKHMICEKPMAITPEECQQMIQACKDAGKLLSIGYRLHFEPNNMTLVRLAKDKVYGKVKTITAKNGFRIQPGVWRLDKELAGGGPLMDVGIYCVQGAIYVTGNNPIAITAKEGRKTDPEKFTEVEESITWTMDFPDGAVCHGETSYSEGMSLLRADAETGWYELQPAYGYGGITGNTKLGNLELIEINQQAMQMDDFANCVVENKPSRVPGEMGLRDVKILQAIYESARTGKKVSLKL